MIEQIKRLHGMSAPEIAHRVRERFRRGADKLRFYGWSQTGGDLELDDLIQRHGASLRTYFLNGPARRFYPSLQNRQGTVDFFMQRYPEWLDRTMQEAVGLCERRVKLLSYENVPLGNHFDWHRDPVSGYQWPRRYWADYDFVSSPSADVKVIHELNRHQHLPRLAKAFFLTGDETYASEAISQIESWIEQNPKWHGVNWQSSLEIAIRSISWLWTIMLLLASESLDEERLRLICRSLFAQLDYVQRYPSVYSSPNTHLIGEATSLFIAGTLFPELPRARNWRDFGNRILFDELQKQVSEDGVYGELSTYYHCYAADFYLHAFALAQQNRIELPEWAWTRWSRMIDFIMHITHPDDTIPLLGDDDGGRVLAIAAHNYSSYGDGLCTGAVLLGRSDLKYRALSYREETLWLLGAESWAKFDSLVPRPPAELRGSFEQAGYWIGRSGWGAHDTQVIFDCGGLGMGSGGHGHADALSLTVFSGGHAFLIDPGTFVYNGSPDWRRFFRSTGAHNTLVVDDKGQSEPGSTFRWKTKAAGRARKRVALTEIDYIDGEVDLIQGRAGTITHRRRLIHVSPNYWIVLDDAAGKGKHNFDFLYHFAPNTQLSVLSDEKRGELECRAAIEQAGLQLYMYASEAVRAEAVCGQTGPIQGWASDLYGERRASPVVKVSLSATAPVSMLSLLVPGNEPIRSHRFPCKSSQVTAVTIRDGEHDDIVVMALDDTEMRLMDYRMRGECFWLRTEQGLLRRLFAVNAYSFSCGSETIFESNDVIPYVQAYFWDTGIVIERGDNEGKVYVRDMRDRQFQRH